MTDAEPALPPHEQIQLHQACMQQAAARGRFKQLTAHAEGIKRAAEQSLGATGSEKAAVAITTFHEIERGITAATAAAKKHPSSEQKTAGDDRLSR